MNDSTRKIDAASDLMHMDTETIRSLGYRIVDMIAYEYQDLSRRPVYPPPQTFEQMEACFGGPPPRDGTDPDELLDLIRDRVLPASSNYNHPNLTGYVSSTSLPLPGLVEALVGTLRLFPYTWKMTPACSHIEATVARWLGQMVGFADDAAGYVTTGGSWANLMGLAVARTQRCGWNVKNEGLGDQSRLTAYCSAETHSCLAQSMRLLGMGSDQLRNIPVDEAFRLRVDALEAAIESDLAAGCRPFCIIGTAGTTNTGAVDPLEELADVARRHRLWYHIDGAYGAFAALDPRHRKLSSGFARADSLVLDPHKWLNIPYDAGCFLTRRWKDMSDTFALVPEYLATDNAQALGNHWQHGFELTRTDRALKVWVALRQYGVNAFAQMVSEHIALAERVEAWVAAADDFEVVSPCALSICTFRYVPTDVDPSDPGAGGYLDTLNRDIEAAANAHGSFLITGTTINRKQVLRVCIVNHRITWERLERMLLKLRTFGHQAHTC